MHKSVIIALAEVGYLEKETRDSLAAKIVYNK